MKIHERLETQLVNHGLWPKEAKLVITELIADESSKPMQGRWNEDEADYPPQLSAVLLISAKQKAIEWIDRNKPKHFARAILEFTQPPSETSATFVDVPLSPSDTKPTVPGSKS